MRNNFIAIMRGRVFSPHGNCKHLLRQPTVMPDGKISLKVSGVEDTDEIIESFRMSTDLSVLLTRYKNGDTSVLNRYQAVYADLTNAPKNYREAMDKFLNAESAFMALPDDLRKKFGNDWRSWIANAGTKEWLDIMFPVVDKSDKPNVDADGDPQIGPIEKE